MAWIPCSKFVPPTVSSVSAGQVKFSAEPILFVINDRGVLTTEKRVDSRLGEAVFTTSKAKQTRLLPSRRV